MSNITKFEDKNYDLQTLKAMAIIAVNSGKYGPEYNEATVLNIFLTAKSLEIDPMVALNGGFQIIKGKINMSAHFMTALARRSGHSIKVIEVSDQKCTIIGQRKDNGDSIKYEYTWQDAVRANLSSKQNWKDSPKNMLYCACVRNVFRMLFSDLGIAYDADEMNVETSRLEEKTPIETPISSIEYNENLAIQNTEKNSSDSMQSLKTHLEDDGLETNHLEDYIKGVCEKKGQTREQILASALKYLQQFKTAYARHVLSVSPAESVPL